jgi:CubicO group peptidase (beta-lactamase class C family)
MLSSRVRRRETHPTFRFSVMHKPGLKDPLVKILESRPWIGAAIFAVSLAVTGTAFAADEPTTSPAPSPRSDSPNVRAARIESGIEPLSIGTKEPALKLDLRQLMKLHSDPGLSIAVIDGYKIAWAKAYGVTEAAGRFPVTTRTLFQAGSISKPVAATAMLALVEKGKLSLDEDVNARLKSWKVPENEFTKDQKVTLRRLASHTAGLTVHGFPGYDIDATLPTLVQIFNGEPPANTPPIRVDFIPGSLSRYSGGGITIEQQVMMDVSGETFPNLVKSTVLDKIGMADSSYMQPLPPTWAIKTCSGTYADGKPVHGKWHVYPEMAAAGLWTTPTDLAKFAIDTALSKQGRSNKVLSQTTVREMLTAQPATEGEVGLGFFVPKQHSGEFQHNGADEGFQALLVMNADTGQGAVVMANSDNGILVALEYIHGIAKEYRWANMPAERSVARQLVLIAKIKGVDAALESYDELKTVSDQKKHPDEHVLAMLGDRLLQAGKTEDAIKALEKNATEYPDSASAYESIGEACAAAGQKERAIRSFEKALKIDPTNTNAKDQLKKLTSGN